MRAATDVSAPAWDDDRSEEVTIMLTQHVTAAPRIVALPPQRVAVVTTVGDPNEVSARAVGSLYSRGTLAEGADVEIELSSDPTDAEAQGVVLESVDVEL
jgi:hypothetical protein